LVSAVDVDVIKVENVVVTDTLVVVGVKGEV